MKHLRSAALVLVLAACAAVSITGCASEVCSTSAAEPPHLMVFVLQCSTVPPRTVATVCAEGHCARVKAGGNAFLLLDKSSAVDLTSM